MILKMLMAKPMRVKNQSSTGISGCRDVTFLPPFTLLLLTVMKELVREGGSMMISFLNLVFDVAAADVCGGVTKAASTTESRQIRVKIRADNILLLEGRGKSQYFF
mmetsp:Transcript_1141/g.1868  ORF Transcript_1141/g.1868 Transcript_1141/m.1868 type:complete len:106 (-) Transcript_1141:182-499(-)